jgi:hypothetical protein
MTDQQPDTPVRDILIKLYLGDLIKYPELRNIPSSKIDEALDSILHLALEAVGEDEVLKRADPYQMRALEIYRNDLRKEIREALVSAFKGKE